MKYILQKHEREVLKAVRKTWPGATVEFDKSRRSTHAMIKLVTPEGGHACSSLGSSPSNPSGTVEATLRKLRHRIAASLQSDKPSAQ